MPLAWGGLGEAAYPQTPAANSRYNAAVALQNRGAFKLAAEEWEQFVRQYNQDPRLPHAYHNLGVCYYQEGQLDLALKAFQTVLAKYPDFAGRPSSELYLGATQFEMGKAGKTQLLQTAERTFRGLLAKNPTDEHRGQALYYLGECLHAQGKKSQAIKVLEELIRNFPGHKLLPEAMYSLGTAQQESDQPEAAGKTYEAFLARFGQHPLAPEVILRRGETLLAAGQFAEAAKRFGEAAARADASLADYAMLRQADTLLQLKQHAEAASLYSSIPARFPKSPHAQPALIFAGKCLYLAGKYAEARQLLQPLVEAGGAPAAEATHWLARTLLKQDRPAETLAVLEKALRQPVQGTLEAELLLDRADAIHGIPQRRKESIALYAAVASQHPQAPVAPQALSMAAFVALEQGDYAAALAHASAFLKAHGQHPLAPDMMHVAAESNLQLEKYSEAEALYARLLEQYPDHADQELWRVRRVVTLHARKQYRQTIAALEPMLEGLRLPEIIAEAHFLIGSSHLELGEYPAAIQSLNKALEGRPDWSQADRAWLLLAEAYRRSDNLNQARKALERLIRDHAGSRLLDVAHYRLGQCRAAQGDFPGAAAQYRQLLADWPESPLAPHALHELGCAQLSQKDAAAAEASFTALLEQYPKHPLAWQARYGRGMARHQLGRLSDAAEDLRAVVAAKPAGKDKADAQFLLGLCLTDLNQYEAAVTAFQGLLAEQPDWPAADKARYQLAWALKLSGRASEAHQAFRELIRAFPESPLVAEAQYHVGEFLYNSKEYLAAAKALYAGVQKTEPGSPLFEKSVHKLGWCYYHLGNYANAQKTFSVQLDKCADGPLARDAAFMRAECLFQQDMFAESLEAYGKLAELSNKQYESLRLLHAGQAAGQLKRWAEAARWLARSTEQFPDAPTAPEALYELGFAQQNLGKTQQAIGLYEKVIAMTDREVAARAQFMIGELQFQNKQYSDAVRSYFKVAYGYGYPQWQASATYEAARCFELLGQRTQAAKLYQELIEKFPQSDKAPLAKERLAALGG